REELSAKLTEGECVTIKPSETKGLAGGFDSGQRKRLSRRERSRKADERAKPILQRLRALKGSLREGAVSEAD
ncbi:MAG: hypothetical protein J6D21_07090, partial [Clostridia bacterium]|nr:hypothetical protein [Clostridia bacterium]